MGILTAVLVLAQSWVLSQTVAGVFADRSPAGVPFGGPAGAIGLFALILLGRAGLAWVNSCLAHRSAARVKAQLRHDIVAARLAAPTRPQPTGRLITLMTQGLDALDGYYAKYLPQLGLALTVPVIVLVAIVLTDWESALIIALTLPLIPMFMILIGKVTQARMDRRWVVQSRLAHHFGDLVAGLPTLQVFGRARAQETGLIRTEEKHREETMSTLRVSFLSAFVLELVATYSVALVAVPIGIRLVYGQLDLAAGLFVLMLAPEAYLPVRKVGAHYHDSVDGIAAADEAFAVIDGTDLPGGTRPAPAQGPVALENVSVTYPGTSEPALTGLSLEVRPGEVVALVGPSGSGKSTALAALLGFVAPTDGRVLLAGVDLADCDIATWRSQLAWVAQEPGIINGTIADNVRLGDPGAADAQVETALSRARAAGLGANREIGDSGEGLSAGERRRVALARALLRIEAGGRLLVLDEPTAGLDTDTEAEIIAEVRAAGVAALVVTHRPAVIAAADRVVSVGAQVSS
ncbi:thiol reductant ABC exporter subunit CydD [Granulicoccus phenolivorans]|uniref:thiol reductant ABC exporter subunit CydD n=1 Tax=Granulicoccus phenolivorans TaxID=266854 RepID=UPI000478847C